MNVTDQQLFKLEGKVQHYAWGGFNYIPQLLGIPAGTQPCAEYWMGAHQSAPATITTSEGPVKLDQLAAAHPDQVLGARVQQQFGQLPYLLKILDVKDMLSIQVHPTKSEAEKGFARENEAGIPLNAADRNYKDANHKPEIMVALSEFWLLHGFLPEDKLQQVLHTVPEFASLADTFSSEGYFGLYKRVMEMPQDAVNTLLRPLADRVLPAYKAGQLQKSDPAFWAGRAIDNDPQGLDRLDRGIFSIYFFNIMQVHPGDAVFQDAGIPHAYLEGQNVELMANSDNVLRGGLTPKHIDVPELLKHTRFEAVHPHVINGTPAADGLELIYHSPAPDFLVSVIRLQPGQQYNYTSLHPEILIVMNGQADFNGKGTLSLHQGQSAFITPAATYSIRTTQGALIYKATVNN
ncbi:mannose-6-phosphate isomerase, class I [Chitinophaga pendula]|uniref:mannose-6-phosphate isomerase, class I n=1 Tax=Chitinophaga TaxID=79328 RepID=UPI000BAEE76E|nr:MULTISPECIES: mannose-6-phosphate isomerase, class I [Chitinophaga]ASZ12911.1 mannose-6-phosphate isomerase, class I [Chitinophaga sp. MD30]UCJ09460.1 mannose-6-phosphate isomerase, class I [Chitinophaga pendula]